MSSIYLHEEHGVNPAIYQCYLCGEDIGLILPGARVQKFKDAGLADSTGKMNMHIGCLDMEPCDKCKSIMKQGVIFISTRDDDQEYRTGGWCVVKKAAVREIGIQPPELLESILNQGVCFIGDSAYDAIGLPRD